MTDGIPYADLVGAADPIELLSSTPRRIAGLVSGWSPADWSRSYAEGKWSAAQIVLHLAQDEIAFASRARLALTDPGYVPRPFDGADWVALESPVEPVVALAAFLALRALNIRLYRKLSEEQLARPIAHPELGTIYVGWIVRVLAGHDLHHLGHLETIAGR
jgi:hypothetical protein